MAIAIDTTTRNRCASVASKISARWLTMNSQTLMPALLLPLQMKLQTPALPDDPLAETLPVARPQQFYRPQAIQSASQPQRLVQIVRNEDNRLRQTRANSANSCCNSARVTGSSAPNGSSISKIAGSAASARATPTFAVVHRKVPEAYAVQIPAFQPDQPHHIFHSRRNSSRSQPSSPGTSPTFPHGEWGNSPPS